MFFTDPPLCVFCGDVLAMDWIGGPYGDTWARQAIYWCENPDCPDRPQDCTGCGERLVFDRIENRLTCRRCQHAPTPLCLDPRAGLDDPIDDIPDIPF